jgi:hypothetical protein
MALLGSGGGPNIQLNTPVTVSYTSGGVFGAYAGYRVDSDAFVYTAANFTGVYSQQEQWDSDPTTVGNYEVQASKVGFGDTPSGSALNSWLPLSSDQAWQLFASGDYALSCTLTVQIRDIVGGVVRATATVDLFADNITPP